jgi:hypothetical protein
VDLKGEEIDSEWKILLPNGNVTLKVIEKRKDKVNNWREGLYWASFEIDNEVEKEVLMRHLYGVDWHWMLRVSKHSHFAVEEGLGGDWQPIQWQKNNEDRCWGMTLKDSNAQLKLVCSHRLNRGDEIQLYFTEKQLNANIMSEIELKHPIPGGLHGAEFWFYTINHV